MPHNNDTFSDRREQQARRYLEVAKALQTVGVSRNSLLPNYLDWMASPLAKGKYALGAEALATRLLGPQPLLAELALGSSVSLPQIHPGEPFFCLGQTTAKRAPFCIPTTTVVRNALLIGRPGSGKSNLLFSIISQAVSLGISVLYPDHKNESSRLQNFLSDVAIVTVQQLTENLIEPVGAPNIFYTAIVYELARCYNIRRETAVKVVQLLCRLQAGRRNGEPELSLKDLEQALLALAECDSQPTLKTVAGALMALNAVLGRNALVRSGPRVERRHRVVAIPLGGVDPRFLQFFLGVRLVRMQLRAAASGHHNEALRGIYISDEGNLEFGREYSSATSSMYVDPAKRRITQARSSGIGTWAGCQVLSEMANAYKAAAGTIICFSCPNPRDAKEALELLRLPSSHMKELQSLPVGEAYAISEAMESAVRIRVPYFEAGPYLSTREIQRRMRPIIEGLKRDTVYTPDRETPIDPINFSDLMSPTQPETSRPQWRQTPTVTFLDDHFALLREIQANPDLGTVAHYKRIGWGAARGNRVRNELRNAGLIEAVRQKSDRGRPIERMRLTSEGLEVLDVRKNH